MALVSWLNIFPLRAGQLFLGQSVFVIVNDFILLEYVVVLNLSLPNSIGVLRNEYSLACLIVLRVDGRNDLVVVLRW